MADETTATLPPPTGPTPASVTSAWLSTMHADLPSTSPGGARTEPQPKEDTNGETRPEPEAGLDNPPAKPAATSVGADGKTDAAKPTATAAPVAATTDEEKYPRTSQDWKKFKDAKAAALKERDAKIEALTKELTETKSKVVATPTDSPEWKAIQKERDELSERLRVTEVTQHPKFVAYFKNKTDQQVSLAKAIVGADNADKVEKLLAAPDSEWKQGQLEEMMIELGPVAQSRFGAVINALAAIEDERKGEIAKSKESYELLQKQKEDADKTKRAGLEKLFTDIVRKAIDPKDGMPAYQKRAEDTEEGKAWNKSVDERLEVVKTVLTKGEPTQVIQMALDAAAFPEVLKQNLKLREDLTKAQEQVKKLSAASPTMNGGRSVAPAGGENGNGHPNVMPKVGMRPNEAIGGWIEGFKTAFEEGR